MLDTGTELGLWHVAKYNKRRSTPCKMCLSNNPLGL